jgi:formyl-CoA transferase
MGDALPLANIRVLDLTRARSGPTCVRQLADWGADVIKVESAADPSSGDGMGGTRHGFDFQNLQRNKRSVSLNLKEPAGKAAFMKLAETADVIVENYRPDVKKRLGIDYDAVSKINPRIVYGSISGFGQTGPYANRPGYDQIAQGMGGLMSITGIPGQGPVRVGIPICDLTAGIFLAQGIILALFERVTSGKGQWVHTSLLQAQIQMLDFQAARWTIKGEVAPQAGNDHPTGIPTGVFPTKDGHMNIAASGQEMYRRLCNALGCPELIEHPDYKASASRSKNRKAMNEVLGKYTSQKTTDEWIEIMEAAGVPCGPIYSIDQTFNDVQVKHLGMAMPLEHPKLGTLSVVGQAMTMTRTPMVMRRHSPDAGEHTDEILGEVGYSPAEIDEMRKSGAI